MSHNDYIKVVNKCKRLNINASIQLLNNLIARGICFEFIINNVELLVKEK